MKKTELRKYARLIVRDGIRVQKGQPVVITATLEQPDFTAMVVEECYKAGASRVEVRWNYEPITRLHHKYQSEEELANVPEWQIARAAYEAETLPCRLNLRSTDPDGAKGYDPSRSLIRSRALSKATRVYREKKAGKDQWSVVGVPNKAWAKKLFPHLRPNAAVEELWKLILQVSRCGEDPEGEWRAHNANLDAKCDKLNSFRLRKIRMYADNGTDLVLGLIPQSQFINAQNTTPEGLRYNADIPTEECYITPNKWETEGIVYGALPWCWNGVVIENYWLRFCGGKVVDCGAEKYGDVLKKMIETDEGAAYLGELALVPWESPVNQTGILFYDTLFDENARCHLAMGRGFNVTIRDFGQYTAQQFRDMGVNESVIHQDFMVGTEDMNIDGITEDGQIVPIFRNGTWAF